MKIEMRKGIEKGKQILGNQQGYLSLEAAYIFPMTFFFILGAFYLSMYLSDKAKTQAIVEAYAREEAICLKDQTVLGEKRDFKKVKDKGVFYYLGNLDEEKSTLTEQVKEEVEASMLLGKVSNVDAKLSYLKVEVQAKIKVNIGISRIKEYFTGSPLSYTVSISVPVHNPEEFVRVYTQVQSLFDQQQGQEETKENIKEIKLATKE